MINFIIKQAEIQDLREILQLQKQAFITEAEQHGNYEIEPLKQTYESILSDFESYSFLKMLNGNEIIGSVKYKAVNGAVWVGKLMINPRFRRQGLGKRLLLEVEKLNPEAIRFQLFTAASSIQNIKLYESVGYKVCNKYKDNAQSGLEMVEMIKLA
ncbi:MAG: GNAT family N-acetyltransferase [Tannerella sp.]|jgi:ribosomal protein S18 acetylase RimI-like enzyme|nr:GNAT family N-acetyltransferase [Tannerella sp.]